MALANAPDCRRKGQHPERVRASGAAPVGANMLQFPFRLSAGCPAFKAYSVHLQHARFVDAMARCPRVWGLPIEGENVNAMKMLGIILIVGGILGLVYGGFTYTKETHETKIGPLVLSVTDKETVNVPIWAGVGAIVIGGLLLVFGSRKS